MLETVLLFFAWSQGEDRTAGMLADRELLHLQAIDQLLGIALRQPFGVPLVVARQARTPPVRYVELQVGPAADRLTVIAAELP